MPIVRPFLIAWKRNTECIASLTGSFPLNEKETLLMPPESFACGRFVDIYLQESIKSFA